MTNNKLIRHFQYSFITIIIILASFCSSTSARVINGTDYGKFPRNYKETAKSYIVENPSKPAHDLSTTQFLNTPDKFTYERLLGDDQFGYRVCALIRTSDNRKTNTHFFLIKNGKVIQHKQDRGLLTLSDEYCSVAALIRSRINNETDVNEAPEKTSTKKSGIKYLVCVVDGDDKFFTFNSKSQQLQEEHDGLVVSTLIISQSSDTFIIAENESTRTSINRITGAMIYLKDGNKSKGNCELTRRQKF